MPEHSGVTLGVTGFICTRISMIPRRVTCLVRFRPGHQFTAFQEYSSFGFKPSDRAYWTRPPSKSWPAPKFEGARTAGVRRSACRRLSAAVRQNGSPIDHGSAKGVTTMNRLQIYLSVVRRWNGHEPMLGHGYPKNGPFD